MSADHDDLVGLARRSRNEPVDVRAPRRGLARGQWKTMIPRPRRRRPDTRGIQLTGHVGKRPLLSVRAGLSPGEVRGGEGGDVGSEASLREWAWRPHGTSGGEQHRHCRQEHAPNALSRAGDLPIRRPVGPAIWPQLPSSRQAIGASYGDGVAGLALSTGHHTVIRLRATTRRTLGSRQDGARRLHGS